MDDRARYADAEAFYREALPIFVKSLGEDHDETTRTYDRLAPPGP